MKILQINNVYKNGSTGKIVYDIHKELQEEGVESIVCYGRGSKEKEANVYKISSEILSKLNVFRARITGLQYNGSWLSTHRLIRIIRKEKPDILQIHCINGNFLNIYKFFKYIKKQKIKTVITLHAEFMHTGSCGHAYECEKWKVGCGKCPQLWNATKSYWFDRTNTAWLKMKNSFDGFNNIKIISVSKWLEDRAKQSPIMEQYSFDVITNGIDVVEIFKPTDFKNFKKKHGLKDEKLLLHVTANFSLHEEDIKGGRYIVQLAERLKDENIKIIVVGGRDLKIPLPDNIINIGRIKNQKELAAYYSMADLTILTSKRETFSMVCAESLSCGTPVIGFKAGGPESIALEEYSKFVEYANIDLLEKSIFEWINIKSNFTSDIISSKSSQTYSRKKMSKDYIKLYNQLMRK